MDSRHCPRCGATLPDDEDEVLCPGCGFALGAKTEAIEVSPDELLAEIERRRRGPTASAEAEGELDGEVSVVTTTPSGLLKGAPARQTKPNPPTRVANTGTNRAWVVVVIVAIGLAVAVWLSWDLLP